MILLTGKKRKRNNVNKKERIKKKRKVNDVDVIISEDDAFVQRIPNFLNLKMLKELKTELNNMTFESLSFNFYGKISIPERKTLSFSDNVRVYNYSGQKQKSHQLPEILIKVKNIIEKRLQTSFNFVLAQYYPTGGAKLSWHSDSEKSIKSNSIIASLSCGCDRRFWFREKKDHKKKIKMVLKENDLISMEGTTQKIYDHTILEEKQLDKKRWNLTFRQMI